MFGSRLRITAGHQITSLICAVLHVLSGVLPVMNAIKTLAFDEVRNSYLGLESQQFGTFMAGNYNSFYDDYVTSPFDVYVEDGYELAGGGLQARGDSLGYISPEINGFQAVFSAKHFSERGFTASRAER